MSAVSQETFIRIHPRKADLGLLDKLLLQHHSQKCIHIPANEFLISLSCESFDD
jgi:hypothetical protein